MSGARNAILRTAIVAATIAVAIASRYNAIVMGGEVLHVMKIDAKETETTARAIAAYGPPRIGPRETERTYVIPTAAKGAPLMDDGR